MKRKLSTFKTVSKKTLTVSVLSAACALSIATPAHASGGCVAVEGEANNMVIGPFIPGVPSIAGVFRLTVGDTTRIGDASGMTTGDIKTGDDGTLHIPVELKVDFPEGDSITFSAKQIHSPTDVQGEFRLNERVLISDGSGDYKQAFGRLVGHGKSSFNTFTAHAIAKGLICGL